MLHRGGVETVADEGALGGLQDSLAPFGVGGPPSICS
jgi:hypothetical protein